MNVVLATALPITAVAYLTSSVALLPGRFTVAAIVAFGVLWLTATVAFNTIRRPRQVVLGRVQEIVGDSRPRQSLTPAYPSYVVDVSRPLQPWRWRSVLVAPFELLLLAWSVPVLILLVMVPIGLVLAAALVVGRLILRL